MSLWLSSFLKINYRLSRFIKYSNIWVLKSCWWKNKIRSKCIGALTRLAYNPVEMYVYSIILYKLSSWWMARFVYVTSRLCTGEVVMSVPCLALLMFVELIARPRWSEKAENQAHQPSQNLYFNISADLCRIYLLNIREKGW